MTPVFKQRTPSEEQRGKVGEIIKNILKKNYTNLKLSELSIRENVVEKNTEVACKLLFNKKKTNNKRNWQRTSRRFVRRAG